MAPACTVMGSMGCGERSRNEAGGVQTSDYQPQSSGVSI